MGLLGGPAETAVLPQDPDAPAERSPGRFLAVEAGRPVRVRHKDGEADEAAHLVHPARMQQINISRININEKLCQNETRRLIEKFKF